jgi:poly(A) polymerase
MAERPTHLPTAPWMADPATREVIAALERAGGGGVARFVGGCVRDTLLGRAGEGLDIDIATTLAPPAVIAAAKAAGLKPVPTGVAHGTVTVVARGRPFEVTTLRRDVETDGRRAVVAFTTDWGEDAARRDFRLNALYAESDGRLHDPTGAGVADALAGRVVFVGEPARRIGEDYLRILRFFRFWAWYGQGAPDAAGLAACAALAQGLDGLSAERVTQETLKLLGAPDPGPAIHAMAAAGVLDRVVPDADPAALDRVVAVQQALAEPGDAGLRLAALCTRRVERLVRLRLSNALRDRIAKAGQGELPVADMTAQRLRRRLYETGPPVVRDQLRLAATPADAPTLAPLLAVAAAWTPPRFPVSGEEIKAAGATEGPQVGRVRRAVEAWWIDNDFPDDTATARAVMEAAILRS